MTGPAPQGSTPAWSRPPSGPPPRPPLPPQLAGPGPGQREQAPAEPPGPGLFGSLLGSFDHLVTPRVIKLLFMLAVLFLSVVNVAVFLIGWSLAAGSYCQFCGWVLVIGTPVAWLFELVAARVAVEFLIVQFRIASDLRAVRDVLKGGDAP